VMLSDELRFRYPEEMTIVMQHQFWDLEVEDDRFSIVLSFDNVKQNLTIPFNALVSFADPSVKFGLQFHHDIYHASPSGKTPSTIARNLERDALVGGVASPINPAQQADGGSNVVTLDAFRNKGKK
jgi:uncharacterized protein